MPTSAKRLVEELTFRVTQLEEQIGALQTEKELLRAAKADIGKLIPTTITRPSERIQESPEQKRQETRGQAGHEGHGRELYPIEECHSITDHYPDACWNCGESLEEDPQPYRHQIVEIPPVVAQVEEHRFHQLECPGCGCGTRAWNCEILAHGYGVVVAHVAVLSSLYRHSQRMVQQASGFIWGETVRKRQPTAASSEWSSCRGGGGANVRAAAKRRGDG